MRKVGVLEKMLLLSSSSKRNLVSGFGLGVGASLVVFTLVLFQFSFRTSFLNPMFQGFNGAMNAKSSLVAWPFRFSNTISSCSSAAAPSPSPSSIEFEGSEKTHEGNGTKISSFDSSTDARLVADETHEGDSSKKAKNESFFSEERGFKGGKEHQGNFSEKLNNGSWKNEAAAVSVKTRELNESFSGKLEGSTERMTDMKNGNVSRSSGDEKVPLPEEDKVAGSSSGLADTKRIGRSKRMGNQSAKCDIFDGGWVRDNREPHYPALSCPHIDRDFNCYYNGRRDVEFLKWRWQPSNCNIPRLNASDFLERMRGKRLLFVGDSLNRNMWESLVCILRQAILNKRRVHEISGRREFKRKGSYSFMYKDYNCSIDFISAPFMVKPSSHKVRNRSIETLRLDLMDQTSPLYRDSDVIVFNSGHWWTHEKTSKGENYYQEGDYVYPKLEAIKAYEKALTTWARWVDKNIDPNRTLVFFRGYSLTHFRGGQWNSGGQCHKETEPIFNESYLEKYPSKMIVLENVIRKMKTPVVYLNISKLTDYRKDGHPSIYRKRYKTVQERIEAEKTQDCSHWCLPGIPDTWNELLYASLLQTGIGSWRS